MLAQDSSLPQTFSSDGYRLVVGRRIGYALDGSQGYSGKDPSAETQMSPGRLELWDYLASLRTEPEPRAAIYFPDNNAGPDMVFALEPTNTTTDIAKSQRILCVVQAKTGGIDIKPAIRTTDLWNAYEAKRSDSKASEGSASSAQNQTSVKHLVHLNEKREKVRQELRYWKARTVIRILVATQQETIEPKTKDSGKQALRWKLNNRVIARNGEYILNKLSVSLRPNMSPFVFRVIR